jgi:hypothetical protein
VRLTVWPQVGCHQVLVPVDPPRNWFLCMLSDSWQLRDLEKRLTCVSCPVHPVPYPIPPTPPQPHPSCHTTPGACAAAGQQSTHPCPCCSATRCTDVLLHCCRLYCFPTPPPPTHTPLQVRAQLLNIMKQQKLPLASCWTSNNSPLPLLYCHTMYCRNAVLPHDALPYCPY